MVTELGLDHVADLPRLQGCRSFFEFGNHLSLAEGAEVSPLLLAGAGRFRLGKRREVFTGE